MIETTLMYGNSLACLIMMGFLLSAAWLMPNKGMIVARVSILLLSVYLALQVISPWENEISKIPWFVSLSHIHATLVLFICRKNIFSYMRRAFDPHPEKIKERESDLMALQNE